MCPINIHENKNTTLTQAVELTLPSHQSASDLANPLPESRTDLALGRTAEYLSHGRRSLYSFRHGCTLLERCADWVLESWSVGQGEVRSASVEGQFIVE
jgi:hypothetical protein